MKDYKLKICSFLVFYTYFFKATYLGASPTISGWLDNGVVLLLTLLVANCYKYFISKKYRLLNLGILAYCIVSILSVHFNINYIDSLMVLNEEGDYISGETTEKSAIYSMLALLSSAMFIEHLTTTCKVWILLRTLFVCMGILLIFVDIDAMQHVVIDDSIEGYLIGNKFNVTYLNLYFCTIYSMMHPKLNKQARVWLMLCIAVLMVVSIHTRCTTSLLGAVTFFFFIFFMGPKWKKIFSKPRTFFIALLICDVIFFFFTTWFLQFDFVQDFIVNVLHEDMTLTGRLGIYLNIQEAFTESPWIGYGIGNSGIISKMYTGAYDAQNGLVDMFIQVGIIGCIAYFYILYKLFQQIKDRYVMVFPIIAFVYSTLVISMVEIPFKSVFIVLSLLLLTEHISTNSQTKKPSKLGLL